MQWQAAVPNPPAKKGSCQNVHTTHFCRPPPCTATTTPITPWNAQVVCVQDGLPTWVCELMVSRGNIHEAIEYVKQIEQEIQKAMVIE